MNLSCYVAGKAITSVQQLVIKNPYNGEAVGSVALARREQTDAAIVSALNWREPLTRFQRSQILEKARQLLETRNEEFARLITAESGLCIRETRYEVGRALDVLRFASMEALRDDGEVFSCDVSPQGKARKIFTLREPLNCAVCITPFNHPLNQVAHKLAPAIAAGTPVILKPSEKTPLTAIKFAELLYQAGLPGPMLSVLLGPAEDADLELAVTLAAEGSYRNSGQRCTAVKRILVHRRIAEEFTLRLVEKTREYVCGDPTDEATRVGTVIDEQSAIYLETVVREAVAAGGKVLIGGGRKGALLHPAVIANVPRDCRMVVCESFGPLAPILTVNDLEDAITVANSTAYGLSCGVITRDLGKAIECVKRLRCGTVNINEVPGYRVENSPFGGIKDSGLGVKEGVAEAMKCFSFVKTFSLPW